MLELLIGRPIRKVIYERVIFPRRKDELDKTGKLETGKLEMRKLEKTGKLKPVLKRRKSEKKISIHHLTRST
jgi:hypothetical protein